MRKFITGCLMLALSGAPGTVTSAQVTDALKKAGHATKEAGEQLGEATKDVGKATVDTTKKGAEKTKAAVTGETKMRCADGTKQMGKTAAEACEHHGGARKK